MNWKERAVAFAMLLGLLCLSLLTPAPARACAECLLEPCYNSPAYGWVRNTVLVQHAYLDVFTHNFKCESLLGGALYWNCFEYGGCGSASPSGLLFNLDDKGKVTAFSVKDKRDAEAILASLNYLGLDATTRKWKPLSVLPVEEFRQPSIQTLALLGLAESGSCVAGK